ncbi:zinc transporter ZIP10 isoform X2 [Drosophila willistoni]|uniref:zinc transporter ZIP10 isoform X2 n=1 Tax=Drosophila willistoni TaxID=7260 RepID=UPI001F085804|nr:zinc transporter ZIP10 isoform X2 [Drosophila willistoni]
MDTKSIIVVFFVGTLFSASPVQGSTEYNRYLGQIFQKYGDGGNINFEGLEHLMFSLGLGQIQFEPSHTLKEHRPQGYNETKVNSSAIGQQTKLNTPGEDAAPDVQVVVIRNHTDVTSSVPDFLEIHDPKHRHPRESRAPEGEPLPAAGCLSPKSLLSLLVDHNDLHKNKLYRRVFTKDTTMAEERPHNHEEEYNEFINSVRITPKAFMKLCPALLSQIDNGVCIQPVLRTHYEQNAKYKIWSTWLYASISMLVLSVCGLLGILLVPLMKTTSYQEILKFLVAIAVGTLAGDALMHLLPHALFKEKKHEQSVDSMIETGHKHSSEAALLCGCCFLSALFMYMLENLLPLLKDNQLTHGHSHGHGHSHAHMDKPQEALPPRELNTMLQESKLDKKSPERPLTSVALMVIIGDGLHNLTDGLAIGAAFASDPVTGLATTFAVLCHELPHELGDFALLLQTGVSIRRAVYMNIVSSVLSFVGMSIGLFVAGVGNGMTQWIYAATAGSFLYIAFADLVPTMSVAHNPNIAKDPKGILIQIFGILLGGLIMLLIAVHEHDLEGLFKSF